ncbi:cobyric acid synthase [Desulfobacterium sp. N47]|uniref:Cobyric acid synthase n=1 Tax=uncultured Desulfobacterium sp. TaxID=201089 RepID=E1YDQ3_9BACT|nr:Cobyric acid synthase [uncultured Desulfobacterium sp.]
MNQIIINNSSPTKKRARCLAVLGTGSDVGKSIVVTALCRMFSNRGIKVAPFKAQNMSNNSGITPEGLEMGRAQIVQAEASRIPPHVDMNPVLLKPTGETGSQIVLLGTAVENSTAFEYHTRKKSLFEKACGSLDRLRDDFEFVILEGAGSCAEVNLMPNDIVNLSMAEYADAPVILVGDIHRGGIFAQLVGTLECIEERRRKQIAGFIINRFRGDLRLFEDGKKWIENRTGKQVLGVLPWYNHIMIDAEDSVVIEAPGHVDFKSDSLPAVAVIRLPHISNFTDFDPLSRIKNIRLNYIQTPCDLSGFKAVIIPGSKNTRYDLKWLEETGWSDKITAYADSGGHVIGICGGYQMLGNFVHDPYGLEGTPGTSKGLFLLPIETTLKAPKVTTLTRFSWDEICGTGYEIHMGQTVNESNEYLFEVSDRNNVLCRDFDGCISQNKKIMGTYMHGIFDSPLIAKKWLESIGIENPMVSKLSGFAAKDKEYDLLAEHFEKYIDVDAVLKIAEGKYL